jgi:hypothetical protein
MKRQKMTSTDLAKRTGKQVDHIEAVLDGYPNTKRRPTELDTVDEKPASLRTRSSYIRSLASPASR